MTERSFDELIERQRNLDVEYFRQKRELLRSELAGNTAKWIINPQLNPERQAAVRAAYKEGCRRSGKGLRYAVGMAGDHVVLGYWHNTCRYVEGMGFYMNGIPADAFTWWPV